jgi:hypothetical protein
MATIKKAQYGDRITGRQKKRLGRIAEKNPERAKEVAERMKLRATRRKRGSELYDSLEPDAGSRVRKSMEEAREASKAASKAKNGKSFPDLNKDGKITKADILKGRGVIKNGGKIKKAQDGATTRDSYKVSGGDYKVVTKRKPTPSGIETKAKLKRTLKGALKGVTKGSNLSKPIKTKIPPAKFDIPESKYGSKIKKAQAGLKASNKRVGPSDPYGAFTEVQKMNLPPRNVKTKISLTKNKQLGATKMMKYGGKPKKKK